MLLLCMICLLKTELTKEEKAQYIKVNLLI